MEIQDDRTPEQKSTHTIFIVGTDRFMSGWGKAQNGTSYAAWACTVEDEPQVWKWVERRSDMDRVRIVDGRTYRPKGHGHCHIYVVTPEHPARKG